MLATLAEVLAYSRGLVVDSKTPLNINRLEAGAAAIGRRAGDKDLADALRTMIERMKLSPKPSKSQPKADGGGGKPPTGGSAVTFGDEPPNGVRGTNFDDPKLEDSFRFMGVAIFGLIKALVDGDECPTRSVGSLEDYFCIMLQQEMKRPLRPGECELARKVWHRGRRTIKQIAQELMRGENP